MTSVKCTGGAPHSAAALKRANRGPKNRAPMGKIGEFSFSPFLGFWGVSGGKGAFRTVPGGRGFILTKLQPKRRHLDPIQAIFHDFELFFGCNVAYSGAMLPILGNVTYSGQCYIFWALLHIQGFVTYSGLCYICLLYTSPSPRDATLSRMPSSA